MGGGWEWGGRGGGYASFALAGAGRGVVPLPLRTALMHLAHATGFVTPFPPMPRTHVQPIDVGGVAGGVKFLHAGQFFKVCTTLPLCLVPRCATTHVHTAPLTHTHVYTYSCYLVHLLATWLGGAPGRAHQVRVTWDGLPCMPLAEICLPWLPVELYPHSLPSTSVACLGRMF